MSYHEIAIRRIRKFYPSLPPNVLIPPAEAVELLIGSGMTLELSRITVQRMTQTIAEIKSMMSEITPDPKDPTDAA